MANWTPKITYTELGTGTAKTITFSSPPEGDPFNEKISGVFKKNQSSDGSTQTQWNYNKQEFDLKFLFETSANKTLFDTFLKAHAYQGGVFRYYSHSDESDYETYMLSGQSVKYDRPIPDGSGDFEYNFSFKIERVIDFTYEIEEVGVGAIPETQFTIVNNTGPADVTGLAFDYTLIRGARIHYTVNRYHVTPNSEVTEFGEIQVAYNTLGTTWEISRATAGDAGMTFSITAAGQIQYVSSDIAGTPTRSIMRFRASTIAIEV